MLSPGGRHSKFLREVRRKIGHSSPLLLVTRALDINVPAWYTHAVSVPGRGNVMARG
jgi:hypothetical protein